MVFGIAAETPPLPARAVNSILGRISDALMAGDRVELRGITAFTVTKCSERTAGNPKTGKAVQCGTRSLQRF